MKLTRLQKRYIQNIKNFQTHPPTFFSILRKAWFYPVVAISVLSVLSFIQIKTPGFPGLQVLIGFVLGATVRTIVLIGVSTRIWPLLSQLINWDKVKELANQQ